MINDFNGKKIDTIDGVLDYISNNTGEWCWSDEKLRVLAKEFLENQRIVERAIRLCKQNFNGRHNWEKCYCQSCIVLKYFRTMFGEEKLQSILKGGKE